jgi:hypothetical protein
MIFVHRIRPVPRLIAVFMLTMIGLFLLAAPSIQDIAIGGVLLLIAILIVADTIRVMIAWFRSYSERYSGRADW